jgi:LysM repeat protein
MKKMLMLSLLAFAIVGIVVALGCGQNPERNPVIQKKFKEIADLTERVQSLEDRFKTFNTDIETILDDITTIKQEMAKSSDAGTIKQITDRLDRLEAQTKGASARRAEAKEPKVSAEGTEGKAAAAGEETAAKKVTPRRSREAEYVVPKGSYHDVKAGETLESIAKQNGLTTAKLAEANHLPTGAVLNAGQKIFIPKTK